MIYEGLVAARRQVELLYGAAEAGVDLRFLKKGEHTITWENCHLTPHIWEDLMVNQYTGYQVYIKPNLGGWRDAEITETWAYFIDGDDIPLPDALGWHLRPDFVVARSPVRWQAWWTTGKRGRFNWRQGQLSLAAHYGTDKMVATEATLMRLAGTLNLKGERAVPYTLDDFS